MPPAITRYLPRMAADEVIRYWGPVKYRSAVTEGHPLGRAARIALLTNQNLWYCGSDRSTGVPLHRVARISYVERRLSGFLRLELDSGHVHEFFEGRRYMRRLRRLL